MKSSPFEVKPRRSLRNTQYGPSGSPQRKHDNSTGSTRSDPEDSFGNDSDSFEDNSENTSLNSTRQSAKIYPNIQQEMIYKTITHKKYTEEIYEFKASKTATKSTQESKSTEDSHPIKIYLAFFIAVIVIVIALFLYRSSNPIKQPKFQCPRFKELQKQFTHQDGLLWKSLAIGIENVLNQTPAQPSVFLLAYNDLKSSETVMANILNATANCMQSQNPIKLDGRSFATELMLIDYGVIIETYRQQLESEGIMYVADLDETPAKAAQAFHTICDTITPFVERSVIFFTLRVDQYHKNMPPKQVHELVEAKLEHNWDEINRDTLKALIGRVTDQVFLLHSENDVL